MGESSGDVSGRGGGSDLNSLYDSRLLHRLDSGH